MRIIFFSAILTLFMLVGIGIPIIAAAGYVWVDLVIPQNKIFYALRSLPLSSIFFSIAVTSYILFDRANPPRRLGLFILLFLFLIWVTLTSTWAELPKDAWRKWEWAMASILFAMFMPFVFRTRVQIELFLLLFSFSVASYYLAAGVIALVGSQYGKDTGGNSSLLESSTFACIVTMLIPINIFLMRNSLLFAKPLHRSVIFGTLIVFQVLATVGSYARTGVISLIVLYFTQLIFWPKIRKRFIITSAVLLLAVLPIMAGPWMDRMSTITTYEEDSSAMGRLGAWAWTLDYVEEHPFGGGFGVYKINKGEYYGVMIEGKAFHNIFFEVLGEHGYPGLIFFSSLFLVSYRKLRIIRKSSFSAPDQQYMHEISTALLSSLLILLAGGQFIGIAFQPFTYYLIGLTICLDNLYFSKPQNNEPSITKLPQYTIQTGPNSY